MSANKFKPGDEVQHKSGGPKLIFLLIADDGKIICAWWNEEENDFSESGFSPNELVAYVEPVGMEMSSV